MFLWDCIKSKSSPEKKLPVIHVFWKRSQQSLPLVLSVCLSVIFFALIGQLSIALWLAEYLVCVMEMLHPLPYCDAASRRDETKTIKPTINEAFVAFSEDILSDYNDSYSLLCVAPRKHNTMSAFVIAETPNKHYSTLLKTRITLNSQ